MMNLMSKFSAILLMAGNSTRFNQAINKSLYEIKGRPLFTYSLSKFSSLGLNKIYLVVKEEEKLDIIDFLGTSYKNVEVVLGGSTRQESVKNALKLLDTDYVLIHDCARALTNINDIKSLINQMYSSNYLYGSLYHDVTDTIKEINNETTLHLNRNNLKAVTTPQCFKKDIYEDILNNKNEITDELSVCKKNSILYIKETSPNIKVTTYEDLEYVNYLLTKNDLYKIGHSYDYHNFKDGEELILGGIHIASPFGLEGYSDSDVIYHSVCEAILGALGLGDIGTIFPDTAKENYKRNSLDFVTYALDKLNEFNYEINNIDIMVYLQKPNLKNYKPLIKENLKKVLNTDFVNIKATTLEKQGLIGTCKGIGTETVVLIKSK